MGWSPGPAERPARLIGLARGTVLRQVPQRSFGEGLLLRLGGQVGHLPRGRRESMRGIKLQARLDDAVVAAGGSFVAAVPAGNAKSRFRVVRREGRRRLLRASTAYAREDCFHATKPFFF